MRTRQNGKIWDSQSRSQPCHGTLTLDYLFIIFTSSRMLKDIDK